jgi:plasmid stabilization system protein ParE
VTLELRVEPEAEAEAEEAAAWYDIRNPGLGEEFLRSFEAVLNRIQRNPKAYGTVYRSVRRATLRRFPYNVFYTVLKDEVVVVACIHGKRDPRRWKQRV